MSNVSVQNLEEAAAIASEFISSLDNLPSEIQHLLQEIRHKEQRTQELLQEINKDSTKFIKHSLRQAPPSTPATPAAATPSSSSPAPTKYAHLPAKIKSAYAEIDQLAVGKIAHANRIVHIIARAKARLEYDLARVGILSGELPLLGDTKALPLTPSASGGVLGALPLGGEGFALAGRNPAAQISESLRQALASGATANVADIIAAATVPVTTGVAASTFAGHTTKKRRLNNSTSIKLPSPAPASTPSAATTYPRSRLSRQIHPPRPTDDDQDADGDEDADADGDEEGEEGEDPTLYCVCQEKSYGDMIGCDNKHCPFQWFHVACVDVKMPLPETWYCDHCIKAGVVPTGRKGRKKQNG